MASDDAEAGGLSHDLRAAEAHFEQAIGLFQAAIGKVRAGTAFTSSETERASEALLAATNTLLNYKVRIHDERKRHSPVVSDGALDLDDARLKVGRLLDRLRAHRDPGPVPE